jgi:hypothetical protein
MLRASVSPAQRVVTIELIQSASTAFFYHGGTRHGAWDECDGLVVSVVRQVKSIKRRSPVVAKESQMFYRQYRNPISATNC